MKKIILFLSIILIIIGVSLFPLKTTYKEGTEVYSAILYKYIIWDKNIIINEKAQKYKNTKLLFFPNNFKSLEEYWKEEEKMLDIIKINKNKPKPERKNIEKKDSGDSQKNNISDLKIQNHLHKNILSKQENRETENWRKDNIENKKEKIQKKNILYSHVNIIKHTENIKKDTENQEELTKKETKKGKEKQDIKLEAEQNIVQKVVHKKKKIIPNTGKKYVALTFDDGPHKTLTPRLLDILKKHNIKATFFVLGQKVHSYPDILKREHAEGHEIGNHSWNHPYFTRLTPQNQKKEVLDTDNEIKKHINIETKYFRPPYGAFNKQIQKNVGKTILMWNVDSKDWKYRNIKTNMKHVDKDLKNGSIILFHDIHKTSIDTIEPLIKKLHANGYAFVTVSELLEMGQEEDFSHKACYGEFDCR